MKDKFQYIWIEELPRSDPGASTQGRKFVTIAQLTNPVVAPIRNAVNGSSKSIASTTVATPSSTVCPRSGNPSFGNSTTRQFAFGTWSSYRFGRHTAYSPLGRANVSIIKPPCRRSAVIFLKGNPVRGLFKTPEIPMPELDEELMRDLRKQQWKLDTFQSLAIGGAIQLFNRPDTIDEWLDRMYDQLIGE